MAWLALDTDGTELIYDRVDNPDANGHFSFVRLPLGSHKKLIGRNLRKNEMPVELKPFKDVEKFHWTS